ncbi:MAG: sulfotransferase domain-containing protein [Flavobacteriales bacterium]|nr:sulfotransferase domain-containing protein [Flavobacteriales bacterium]
MGKFSDYFNRAFPTLGMLLINRPAARKRLRGRIEGPVVEGATLMSRQGKPSVVFFSCHKAGSSISLKYLKKLMRENDLRHVNYEGYITSICAEKEVLYEDSDFLSRAFSPSGYFFGCLRSYRHIPALDQYRVILLLRDPRDILVSHYYTVRYINTIYHKRGIVARKMAKKMTPDEYALHVLPRFKKVFEEYIEHLLGKENVFFARFEDLIQDSAGWLKQVSEHCNLECSIDLRQEIAEKINSLPKKEEKRSHHRKASPGEFRLKLAQETQDIINRELQDILKKLNYV